ncbi:60S ribosomal protein uL22 [Lodderomyces beijingensis]|uniref:60S ribosomal protein L17 n=1 Tax=Lodderomyces beijingensis TaxID=1775926 RepID=A0ABP0ZMA1_9ASCO
MVRYAAQPSNPAKSASARGKGFRVSFKNTRETAQAVNGWKLLKAQQYLDQVLDHQRAIPFRRFNHSIGRTGQGKEFGVTKARWPAKSVNYIKSLLQSAQSNAEAKGLDVEKLTISNIQVNQAPKGRRRTYRAHGRINAYKSSPSHIEITLTEDDEVVEKATDKKAVRLNARQRGRLAGQQRLTAAATTA